MPRKDLKRKRKPATEKELPVFGRKNYQLMGGGTALVFLGFALMRMENEIEGFISLFISPLLIIAGFIAFGFGIMLKKPEQDSQSGK